MVGSFFSEKKKKNLIELVVQSFLVPSFLEREIHVFLILLYGDKDSGSLTSEETKRRSSRGVNT